MKNVNNKENDNITKAEALIKDRSLVRYKMTSGDLEICLDLKSVEDIIGIVVENVKYSEVKWIYDSDLYSVEEEQQTRTKKNKVTQIFDYLFGPSLHDKENYSDKEDIKLPDPSMSIDALIDKALSNLSGVDSLYNTHWTLTEEDKAIREYLDDEANSLQPDPAKDNPSLPDDAITGWVRVAWPDKGVTTIEHVSFLEELK